MSDDLRSQFDFAIARRWPDATMTSEKDGSATIHIPRFRVEGYNQSTTAIWFTIPVGFPFACPADFETDGALRLSHGGVPRWTIPIKDGRLRWVHRLSEWSPQRDRLINYWGSIMRRLAVAAEPFVEAPANGQ